jgi:hypothetical protein
VLQGACTFAQTALLNSPYAADIMSLQQIKMFASAAWVLIATVTAIALAVDISSTKGLMLAGFGFLPPLAILLLWNEPAQTMSESINKARR